jgi:hypothetical protein
MGQPVRGLLRGILYSRAKRFRFKPSAGAFAHGRQDFLCNVCPDANEALRTSGVLGSRQNHEARA